MRGVILVLIHKECGGPALEESSVVEVCAILIDCVSITYAEDMRTLQNTTQASLPCLDLGKAGFCAIDGGNETGTISRLDD